MRKSLIVAMSSAVLACAGLQIPVTSGGTGTSTGDVSGAAVSAELTRLTNDARARNGLQPLRPSARLNTAAQLHARQMAEYQKADHTISGARYPTLQARLEAAGYTYSRAAENIAWNQSNADEAMNSWLNSSGHRANIMDPNLTEMGAAMARSADGQPYWIQVFGTPR